MQTLWWGIRPREFYKYCRDKYGPFFVMNVVPFGKLAVPTEPDVVRQVMTSDPDAMRAGEGNNLGDALGPMLGRNSILLLDGEQHRRHRKLMMPPFNGKRMHAYGDVIRAETERCIAGWPLDGVTRFATRPQMQSLTARVIMRVVWGIQDNELVERACVAIAEVLALAGSPLVAVKALRRLPAPLGKWKEFQKAKAKVDAIVYDQIAERRAEREGQENGRDDAREDILSLLLAAQFEDGSRLSDEELRDELVTLLFAGHETTATALAWAFDLLVHNGPELARLVSEIDSGDAGESYLNAVVWESLRVRPVVVDFIRKVKKPVTLGGYRVLPGWHVSTSTYLVNCNPTTYAEPETFRPERFLDERPGVYDWVPFGGGNRRCLGAAFAEYEMRVVLRTVLSRVRLAPGHPELDTPVLRNVTFAPQRGACVVAALR